MQQLSKPVNSIFNIANQAPRAGAFLFKQIYTVAITPQENP